MSPARTRSRPRATTRAADPPLVPAPVARRLLMAGQGLLADPARRAGPAGVGKLIEQMGFVQVDTISVAARAHDHILFSRLDGYRPRMLTKLLERDRRLFEHWTHDASIIPVAWYRQWLPRFRAYGHKRASMKAWWRQRIGPDPDGVLRHVRERITDEGPLMSRDFEHERDPERGDGVWWGWKPQKAALDFLWRSGELAIAGRRNFHKLYDLAERVFPDHHGQDAPDDDEHVDWACRAALERLGLGTPTELAHFLRSIGHREARAWCQAAAAREEIVPVRVASADGSPPVAAWAPPDWARRVQRLPDPTGPHPPAQPLRPDPP